jgi:hypothetical protein
MDKRLYMKAPEYIQFLDKNPYWRALMFLFHTEDGRYIFVGPVARGKFYFYDRGVLKFVKGFTESALDKRINVLEPNTFKLKEVKDRTFLYIVNELGRLAKTEYGQVMLKSPGNKGHILRAVVNRNRVLEEMYNCTGFSDFFNSLFPDDLEVTHEDFEDRQLDAYEILEVLNKKFQFFDFSTKPEDLETVKRIIEILKARADIERKERKRRKSERERNKDNDDWMDDYLADDDDNRR